MAIKIKNKNGFTLIELLVALFISLATASIAYTFMSFNEKAYTVEDEKLHMQQSARTAVEMIQRDILFAGMGSNVFCSQGNVGSIKPAYGGGGANSDSISVYSPTADPVLTTLSIDMADSSDQFQVTDVSGFVGWVNGKGIICDGVNYQRFNINLVQEDTKTIQHNSDYPAAHQYAAGTQLLLFKGKEMIYSIDNSDPSHPSLTKEILSWDNTLSLGASSGRKIVAKDVEAMQLVYILANGTSTQNPANPSDIRAVKITFVARTEHSDSNYNQGDSPFTALNERDGYRRMLLSAIIKPRNI
ncbi:MAG: prepilin-type N-terminal cleavage/methylation domain-containing protein [Candidatus Schekmanbacteria bacterium]|nr:prepilin-type N-terminal cleavage/methylation domain-containing protein [Candidatus Schekmanbacteria bacterium]